MYMHSHMRASIISVITMLLHNYAIRRRKQLRNHLFLQFNFFPIDSLNVR